MKRSNFKRGIALLLATVMMLTLIPTSALAGSDKSGFESTTPKLKPLTKIETVDSASKGITINMFDYGDNGQSKLGIGGAYTVDSKTGGIKQGLYSKTLVNGFPVIVSNEKSTSPLFTKDGSAIDSGKSYMGCNNLFSQKIYDETGYFYYSSFDNYAVLNKETKDFTVYEQIGAPNPKDNNGNYVTTPYYRRGNFFPFNSISEGVLSTNTNDYDMNGIILAGGAPRKGEELYKVASPDYYFGMSLEAAFTTPSGMKCKNPTTGAIEDMIFDFNGDDDLLVYIDGVLVLDLGGIHDAHSGSINFTTGTILEDKTYQGSATTIASTTIYEKFKSALLGEKSEAFKKLSWTDNKTFEEYTAHTIKIFYMERGAGASNNKMMFNLPVIPKESIQLSKEIDGAVNKNYVNEEYSFKLHLVKNSVDTVYKGTDIYKVVNGLKDENKASIDSNGIFKLKVGETIQIDNISDDYKYYFEEVNISDKYSKVKVNGTDVTITSGSAKSTDARASVTKSTVFTNVTDESKLGNIAIKKVIKDDSENTTDTFDMKVYVENSTGVNKPYVGKYTVGTVEKSTENGTIELANGQTAIIKNIMPGTKFQVQEDIDSAISNKYSTNTIEVTDASMETESGQVIYSVLAGKTALAVVTNEYKTGEKKITINKIWNDSDNNDGKRPTTLKVNLIGTVGEDIVSNDVIELLSAESKNVTISADGNTWTIEKTVPKYYKGNEITYKLTETKIPEGYNIESITAENDVYSVTNSHYGVVKEVTVNKEWVGIKADKVELQLLGDNKPVGDIVTVTADDNWTYTWGKLPVYNNKSIINYTVKEINHDDKYISKISEPVYKVANDKESAMTYTITNTYAKTSLTVSKVWNDNNDQDGKRTGDKATINSITVQLFEKVDGKEVPYLADGSEVIKTITKASNWADVTFNNLPKYADNDTSKVREYCAREITVPDGYKATYNDETGKTTVTNSHTPETLNKTVTKIWKDSEIEGIIDQDGVRPDSIKVELWQTVGGKESKYGETITIKAPTKAPYLNNNWTYTWENLPKYSNGEEIVYSVKEAEVDKNYEASKGEDDFIIVNTHVTEKTSVKVKKEWQDNNNQDGVRPSKVYVQLYARYTKAGKDIAIGDKVTLVDELMYEYTWNNLQKNYLSDEINYYVKEIKVITGDDNYNKEILNYPDTVVDKAKGENGEVIKNSYIITNTHNPATTDYTVEKVWNDSNNQDNTRKPVKVTLHAKIINEAELDVSADVFASITGFKQTIELSENTEWKSQWSNVPIYWNGSELTYYVTEEAVEGYEVSSIELKDKHFTVTNTRKSYDTVDLDIAKIWDDKDDIDGFRSGSIFVNIKADGVVVREAVEIMPRVEGGKTVWNTTVKNLQKYKTVTATNNVKPGTPIEYTLEEQKVEGYEAPEIKKVESTNGYSFTITNTRKVKLISYVINVIWSDNDNEEGFRPTTDVVEKFGVVSDKKEYKFSYSENSTQTYSNLPQYSNGVLLSYGYEVTDLLNYKEDVVTKTDEATSTTTITITYSRVPEKTSITVVKNWEDNDNNDGKRLSSVNATLTSTVADFDNKDVISNDKQKLDSDNKWTYTWSNLPVYKYGKKIAYDVKEDDTESKAAGYVTNITKDAADENTYVITNTYADKTTSFTVTKKWVDADNQDGIRPTIYARLTGVAEGYKKVYDSIELEGDNLTGVWKNLPVYKDGSVINYVVSEYKIDFEGNERIIEKYESNISYSGDMINGYAATMTNTYIPETVEKSVELKFIDSYNGIENFDGYRPDEVTVYLKNGIDEDKKIVLKKSEGYKATVNDLPKCYYGDVINYYFEQAVPANYTQTSEKVTGNTTYLEDTHIPQFITKTVQKVWSDDENRDNLRDTVKVQLYQKIGDGDATAYGDPIELTSEDNWKGQWNNLPTVQKAKVVTYYVEEINTIADYTPSYKNGTTPDESDFVITNTRESYKVDVTVNKIWNDNDDQDGIRPQDGIMVQLYANGEEYLAPVELKANAWSYTWKNLPKNILGDEIVYSADEVSKVPDGYTKKVSENNNGIIDITNTHTPDVTSYSVEKVWDDANNQDNIRKNVVVTLHAFVDNKDVSEIALSDIQTAITLVDETMWTSSWENVPVRYNGKVIKYSVTEESISGYELVSNKLEGNKFMLTNKHTPDTVSLNINKIWNDENNHDGFRPNNVIFDVYANGELLEDKAVTLEAPKWSETVENLPKNIFGDEYVYTIAEREVAGYEEATIVETTDNNFEATNTRTVDHIKKQAVVSWEDENNLDGFRPEKVVVQIKIGETVVDEKTIDTDETKTVVFENLDEYKDGKKIEYTITQKVPDKYSQTSESKDDVTYIDNKYVPVRVDKTVIKSWNDADNQDGVRPDSVEVKLLKTVGAGEPKTVDTAILKADNQWTKTWSELPTYEKAQKITYSVEELNVSDAYKSIIDQKNDVFTVTNTHDVEKVTKNVEVKFNDENDNDGFRPDQITIQIKDGDKVIEEKTVTKEDGYKTSFTDLDKYKDGEEIEYKIVQKIVPDKYTEESNETRGDNTVITDKHIPEKVEVTVSKQWDDSDNHDGLRPDEVSMQLYINGKATGEVQKLNETNNWKYTWNDIYKYSNGTRNTYDVKEVAVSADYNSKVNADELGYTFVVVNTHEIVKTQKTVSKLWANENPEAGARPEYVEVQLYADGEAIKESVKLSAQNNWSYTWNELDAYRRDGMIEYTVKEINVPEGYDVSYSDDTFTITNTQKAFVPRTQPPVIPVTEAPTQPPVVITEEPVPQAPTVTDTPATPEVPVITVAPEVPPVTVVTKKPEVIDDDDVPQSDIPEKEVITQDNAPKTGDYSNQFSNYVLLIMSVGGMILLTLKRVGKKEEIK